MALKRICHTCGSQYEYCPSCRSYSSLPKWRIMWDSDECHDLFEIISAYYMNQASKEDVKAVLDLYGVKDYSKYNDKIKGQLDEILGVNKKKKVDIVSE